MFAKLDNNHTNSLEDHVVNLHKIHSYKGNILEGIVVLHETMHELKGKKLIESYSKLALKNLTIRSNGLSCFKLDGRMVSPQRGVLWSRALYPRGILSIKVNACIVSIEGLYPRAFHIS